MKKNKDLCKRFIKNYFCNQRIELCLSQEKMSELLGISPRSYSDLENGKYLCSTIVLINFIIFCDIDVKEFFDKLKEIIKEKE